MVGDSGLLLEGFLISSGLIVSSTAPAAIRRMAERARATYGDLIQICTATDYASRLSTLINALPTATEKQPLTAVIADDGGVRTFQTLPACDLTPSDFTLLPAVPAVNDAEYFGGPVRFDELTLAVGQAGVGVWTVTWEYWNGTAWTALSGVVDGTSGFTESGVKTVSFTKPTDWYYCVVDSTDEGAIPGYYIRARVSAYTSVTTQPLGSYARITVDVGGGLIQHSGGFFYVDESLPSLPSGVRLKGMGDTTRLKVPDGTIGSWAALKNACGAHDISIEDLLIDVNVYNQTDTDKEGIQLDYADHARVRNVTVLNAGGSGAIDCVNQVNWSEFLESRFIKPLDDGFNGHNVNFSAIHGCLALGSQNDNGMDLDQDSIGNVFSNNRCIHNKWRGIFVGFNCMLNTFIGNICSYNRWDGLDLNGHVTSGYCRYNTVVGNSCCYNGRYGIRLGEQAHDNNVHSNTLVGNGLRATNTYGQLTLIPNCDRNLLAGNLARLGGLTQQPRYGLDIQNANDDENVVHGNDFNESGATADVSDAGTTTGKRDNRNLAGNGWLADV